MHVAWLYDEVDPLYGCGAAEFTAGLPRDLAADVCLYVNSPGGLAAEGLSIFSQLQQRTGTVRVVVDGLCASIATIIAQAASPGELLTAPGSMWMIHEAHAVTAGPAAEHRAMATLLDKMTGILAGIYERRTRTHSEIWRDRMERETWMTADEAVASGLADRVLTPAVSASLSPNRRDSRPRVMG